jgi:hypothetical protein
MRLRDIAILAVLTAGVAVAHVLSGVPLDAALGTEVIAAMALQTTYSENITAYTRGQRLNAIDFTALTRICETDAGIGFGLACGQGSADKGAVLGGTLANFIGVSVADKTLMNSVVDEYQDHQEMAVCFRGAIAVVTTVATAPTDPVHYDATAGTFMITGGSGPIVGARWMESRDAGIGYLQLSGHIPVP